MAAPIKVTLELDDRGYSAGMRSAINETKELSKQADQLSSSSAAAFNKMAASTDMVIGKIRTLAGVLLGAQAISGAFKLADELSDLSKATEISIQKILQLQSALAMSGGNPDDAGRMISNLTNTIQAAAEGSGAAQEQLLKLGFSFRDMANLSPEAALQKTINALAQMTNPIERNALAFALLGKQARAIDWATVAEETGKSTAKYDQAAIAAQKAGETFDKFAAQMKDAKIALMSALGPLSEMIDYFDKLAGKGAGGFALTAFKTIFETVAVLAVNIGYVVGQIYEDIASMYEGAKAVLSNPFNTKSWEKAGEIHKKRMEDAAKAAADLLETEKRIFGVNKQQEEVAGNTKKNTPTPGPRPPVTAYYSKETQAILDQVTAFDDLIQRRIRDGKEQTTNISNGADILAHLKAQSELTKSYETALDSLNKKEKEANAETAAGKRGAMLAAVKKAREELAKVYQKSEDAIDKETEANNRAITANNFRLLNFKDEAALRERLNKLQSEQAKMGMTEIEKKYKDIETAALAAANAEILAEAKRKFGVDETGAPKLPGSIKMPKVENAGELAAAAKEAADSVHTLETITVTGTRVMDKEWQTFVSNYLDGVQKRIKAEQEATKSTYDAQRSFSTGWKEAFNQYVSDATNSALQAQKAFQLFSKGFEDVIVNLVTGTKTNFKDLVNSLIAEFVRLQAKKLFAGLFDVKSSGSFFETLMGRATGGPVSANTPYLVGERGPELFVSGTAGRIVNNNQLSQMGGGGVTQVTYNIQAADAASFRQMIARDPEFLYAVTEKGRSGVPGGRR